ncbi:hypothetical protein I545_6271 [Mycobacterium kansasii 662]|uniref:Uncharacterized protein n=1 Tax=Mycobacterium kansasii 662 TaxID=1299326 RepID=X7YPK8_MYCKA|nr:hypothetical protein I545_6271 [Mycobacterium kansasii 662]
MRFDVDDVWRVSADKKIPAGFRLRGPRPATRLMRPSPNWGTSAAAMVTASPRAASAQCGVAGALLADPETRRRRAFK